MKLSHNLSLCKHTNRINLNLQTFGAATVDPGWSGKVTSPPFSRLYYITGGMFRIIGKDGKSFVLFSGKWHLIPSGYSFSYDCHEEMEHFYFHLLTFSTPYPVLRKHRYGKFHFPHPQIPQWGGVLPPHARSWKQMS